MIRIDHPTKPQEPSKRNRGKTDIDKIEGRDLFRKILMVSEGELKSLNTKKWIRILGHLNDVIERDKQPRHIDEVIYHVFKSAGLRDDIKDPLEHFLQVVANRKVFNPQEPLPPKIVQVADFLFANRRIVVTKMAELGLIFNILGLYQAALSSHNEKFQAILRKGILFSEMSKLNDDLVQLVLSNLNAKSIDLFLKCYPYTLPSTSYHDIINNPNLTDEETIGFIDFFYNQGLNPSYVNSQGIDPLEKALKLGLRNIVLKLLELPFNTKKSKKYLFLAVDSNDVRATHLLLKHIKEPLSFSPPQTTKEARRKRYALDTLSLLGIRGVPWINVTDPLYFDLIEERPPSSLNETELLVKKIKTRLSKTNKLEITEGSAQLFRDLRLKLHSIALTNILKFKDLNPSAYYVLLFKKICHVWGLDMTGTNPATLDSIEGEAFDATTMLLYTLQFLEIIKDSINHPALDFSFKALYSFREKGISDLEVLNILSDKEIEPQFLVSGFSEHFTSVILFKNWLIYCDRRGGVGFRVYTLDQDNIPFLNYDLLRAILEDDQIELDYVSEKKLIDRLKLTLVYTHAMKNPKGGFCSHVGVDASHFALLSLYFIEQGETWEEAAQSSILPYKKVTAAYRQYTAQELLESAHSYIDGQKEKLFSLYYYKLLLAIYLRLQENPSKLTPFTQEGPNIANHLVHVMNKISEDVYE